MSRLRRIEQDHRFFFVTTNLAAGYPPLSPYERTLILKDLASTRATLAFQLFSFVVMPDHLHLLFYPQETTLTDILRDFKAKSALSLCKVRGSHGPVWQPRFFDFVCRRVRDFWAKRDYIHQNSVCAGLVDTAEDWQWSSAAIGPSVHPFQILRIDPIELPADGNALIWPAPWR